MAYNSNSGSFDFDKVCREAYSEIVEALSKDMPLIMHGCGDVPVNEVNPESARLLAQLTANYISKLVGAACDSQEILNDGHRPPLPPPPLVSKKRRKAPLPAPYEWPPSALVKPTKAPSSKKKKKPTKADAAAAAAAVAAATSSAADPSGSAKNAGDAASKKSSTAAGGGAAAKPAPAANKPNFGEKKKRKRRDIDYWDDPLPEPRIKNQPAPDPAVQAAERGEIVYKGVPIGDWVGVTGVDLFEESRIRSAHVALPAAIGTQNFVFPVCHDQHLYGKIREIQVTRREMEPILTDSVIMDVIRAETALQGSLMGSKKRRRRDAKQTKAGGAAGGGADAQEPEDEDPEASDSDDEYSSSRQPVWPGLDELLPMHTTLDFFGT